MPPATNAKLTLDTFKGKSRALARFDRSQHAYAVSNQLNNRELLSRLVGFNSSSQHSNRPIADFICDYLDLPGITIDRQASPDDEKLNVIVRIGPEDTSDGGGLVLSGHMDTVPADEPDWDSDPYSLVEWEGHYYGRGVCDMKGFIALAMNTVASFRTKNLERPLALVFTYDEEVGILGSKRLAEAYEGRTALPKPAIVGEPTGLKVVRMHKGFVGFKIVVLGTSAHSGYPHLGRNAIEPAAAAIQGLCELRREFETESPPNAEFFPEVPFVALNVGTVSGGTAPNIVPDRCEVTCSFRTLPGMDTPSTILRVQKVVAETLDNAEYEFAVTNETPPLLLEKRSSIYRILTEQLGQTETHSASYATDAGWLQALGMECAVFGPGNIEVAHRPNESLPIAEFQRYESILGETIMRCCCNSQ